MDPEKELRELLRALHWHRSDRDEYEESGNARGVERCDDVIEGDYIRIRAHCEEHGLPVPPDVPLPRK